MGNNNLSLILLAGAGIYLLTRNKAVPTQNTAQVQQIEQPAPTIEYSEPVVQQIELISGASTAAPSQNDIWRGVAYFTTGLNYFSLTPADYSTLQGSDINIAWAELQHDSSFTATPLSNFGL